MSGTRQDFAFRHDRRRIGFGVRRPATKFITHAERGNSRSLRPLIDMRFPVEREGFSEMAATTDDLSDKALSIFAFAAYHRLLSGERVLSVVRNDGKGHQADPQGVAEIEGKGLAAITSEEISFTDEGSDFAEAIVAGMRRETGR